MSDAHWDLLKKIAADLWPVVTLLLGIFAGAYITNRNQRKQWLLDNKRSEYRKLMTTLSECATQLLRVYAGVPVVMGEKDQRLLASAVTKSTNVIYSRLFIADEVKRLDVMKRWQGTVDTLRKEHDAAGFGKRHWRHLAWPLARGQDREREGQAFPTSRSAWNAEGLPNKTAGTACVGCKQVRADRAGL
jgi:hypothetical protein